MHCALIDRFFEKRSKLKGFLACKVFDLYDLIIAISNSWVDILQKRTKTKIIMIYNPIPLPSYTRPQKDATHVFTVLTLGVLGERKGTADIIKVAQHLKDDKIEFRVAGNGDVDGYTDLAQKAGVAGKVKFIGWIGNERKEEEFLRADLFFLPTYAEALPMSVLEAGSYGLPVVSTPVGGIGEAVEENKSGFLLNPGDIFGFADKIKFFYKNREALSEMGQAGKAHVDGNFCVEKITNQMDAVYRELLIDK